MNESIRHATPVSRRGWLRVAGAAGLAAAASPLVPELLRAEPAPVRPRVSGPDEALRMLMQGNDRFVNGAASGGNRSVARLRELSAKQTPFASILACADSRVPPEILFDQGFGDLFVARVAGNIATAEVVGSLEYATRLLGSQLVIVLGHTACGAVAATVQATEVPGQIGTLFPYIHPAAEKVNEALPGEGTPPIPAVIEENVRHQVRLLRNASPVIAGLNRDKKVAVVGGVFHFETGRVELVRT